MLSNSKDTFVSLKLIDTSVSLSNKFRSNCSGFLLETKLKLSSVSILNLPVSYTHLRAHETVLDLVCRLLLEKKKQNEKKQKH